MTSILYFFFLFFNDPATTEIYTLSLHDALPICSNRLSTPPSGVPLGYHCAAGQDLVQLELVRAGGVRVLPERSGGGLVSGRRFPRREGLDALPLAHDDEAALLAPRQEEFAAEHSRYAGEFRADRVVGSHEVVQVGLRAAVPDQYPDSAAHRGSLPGAATAAAPATRCTTRMAVKDPDER